MLRDGRDPGPRSEMLQATSALSVEERAAWAANSFEFWEGRVGEAEDKFAEPEPESEPDPGPAGGPGGAISNAP